MKILFILCAAITVQWVVENWLSYRAFAWKDDNGKVIHKSYFPNIQTFALTQTGYEITIREAELIHVTLENEYARRKLLKEQK